MSRTCLAAICLGILLLVGCAKQPSAEVDSGTFEGTLYRNPYFGMTLAIPSDWNILDTKAMQHVGDTGIRLSGGNDKNMQAALGEAKSRLVYLLLATEHPTGSSVASNPSIMCIAEHVSRFRGTKTGRDYLFHARRFLEAGQMEYSFPKELCSELIGGMEFHVMATELAWLGATVKQEFHATILKDYALVIVISFVTEEERNVLREALNTLTLPGS